MTGQMLAIKSVLRRVHRLVTGSTYSRSLAPGHSMRWSLSHMYVRGAGIEIGALHRPLPVRRDARVRYVDRMDVASLRRTYPDIRDLRLVPVHIVDDGEKLNTIADGSQDFVIANHFLEHTQDPIGTLRRFLSVLRSGGVLYITIPDGGYTFDSGRPLTTVEHLVRDHEDGPACSYRDHVYEFSRCVHKFEGEKLEEHVHAIIRDNYSIHFHVWTHETFHDFLLAIRDRFSLDFTIVASVFNRPLDESICILQKT
jgi:SAM-dependent methyltransferase